MQNIKRIAITITGTMILLIGVIFIVLPGPAILFIPAGLALLSMEYAFAREWLKQYQHHSRKAAQSLDKRLAKVRYAQPGIKNKFKSIFSR
jgi:hypothetical protein